MFTKPYSFWSSLLLLVMVGFYYPVAAQHLDKHEWARGEIILTSGDTLLGALNYYYKQEIIQVKSPDGRLQSFSPVNITCFRAFDEQKQTIRTFKPFMGPPSQDQPNLNVPAFFEVVTEGKYTLARRSTYVIRNLDPLPMYTSWGRYYEPYVTDPSFSRNSHYQIAQLNVYYLLTPENKIISLRNPKKDLESLYQDKAQTMKAFIRWNNLSYPNPAALTYMVHHLNKL